MGQKIVAWSVQAYTALGLVTGLLALKAALAGDARGAFLWLALSTVIDATDGPLVRRFRTKAALPFFNGRKLDDIVDYLNFVFIPVVIMIREGVLPGGGWGWGAAPLLASAYGFCSEGAKTEDGYFTGFPSYWNIVAFYLCLFGWGPGWNLAVVLALSVLVFIPVKYIDPFKTRPLRAVTAPLTLLWALWIVAAIIAMPDVPPLLLWGSFLFVLYYFAASFWINLFVPGAKGACAA